MFLNHHITILLILKYESSINLSLYFWKMRKPAQVLLWVSFFFPVLCGLFCSFLVCLSVSETCVLKESGSCLEAGALFSSSHSSSSSQKMHLLPQSKSSYEQSKKDHHRTSPAAEAGLLQTRQDQEADKQVTLNKGTTQQFRRGCGNFVIFNPSCHLCSEKITSVFETDNIWKCLNQKNRAYEKCITKMLVPT